MTPGRSAPTVPEVDLRELPSLGDERRPGRGAPTALRVVGFVSLGVIVLTVLTVTPRPGLSGDGPLVPRVLDLDTLSQWIPKLIALDADDLAALPGVSPSRTHQIVPGALVPRTMTASSPIDPPMKPS